MGKKITFNEKIGNHIAAIRKARCVTGEQLAECINISRASLVNIERGRHGLTLPNLYKIASALNVKITSIIPHTSEEYEVMPLVASRKIHKLRKKIAKLERRIKKLNKE